MKKVDLNSVKVFDLIRPEATVWIKLERALQDEGVVIDSRLIEQIIDFAKALVQFKNWRKVSSKRGAENNLDFRIETIRRLERHLKEDEPILMICSD